MSKRIRLVKVDPKKIKVPDVRITSVWEPEEYEIFRQSLEADGIANPIICVKEGDTFWLADGLHRLQEALLHGWPYVEVAYKEGTILDAMLRNLYMNRLRGKTKVTEEIAVLKKLQDEFGLSLEEIEKRTGLSKERIEQRLAIAQAHEAVLSALENEQISIGVAYQLSRLPNKKGQVRLLMEILKLIPPPSAKWVKDIVDESIRIMKEQAQAKPEPPPLIPVRTIKCHLCGQRYEADEMRGINVCDTCLGLAKAYIQKLLREQKSKPTPEQVLAHKVAEELSETGGES